MVLEDKIREVLQTCGENQPPNEAATCEWVILPLLWSIGYRYYEIVPQLSNSAGRYPDYTILPKTEHAWYLEAKEWRRELQDDQDLIQAINYAHTKGRRWVVLSNGREWRLYDDHIQGVEPGERLVATARLEDTAESEAFLTALSRDSVTSGGLERYATMSRLSAVLKGELADRESRIVKKICSSLRSRPGFGDLQASNVAAYFQELFKQPAAVETAVTASPELLPPAQARDEWHLEELLRLSKRIPPYSHPEQVTFPDHRTVRVRWWTDLAFEIVKWFADRGQLPLPFRGLKFGYRWFLNTEPVHENGKEMESYRTVQVGERTVYVDVWRCAPGLVNCLHSLCEAVGIPPSGFIVKLKLKKPLAVEG